MSASSVVISSSFSMFYSEQYLYAVVSSKHEEIPACPCSGESKRAMLKMSPSGSPAGFRGPLVPSAIKGTDSCHSVSAQTAHVCCRLGANCLTCPTASWSIRGAGSPVILAIRWYCTSTNHANATSSADTLGAQTTGSHRCVLTTCASDRSLSVALGSWPSSHSRGSTARSLAKQMKILVTGVKIACQNGNVIHGTWQISNCTVRSIGKHWCWNRYLFTVWNTCPQLCQWPAYEKRVLRIL